MNGINPLHVTQRVLIPIQHEFLVKIPFFKGFFLCAWLVYISRLNLVSDAAWWNIENINKLNQSPIIYNWHNW